MHMPLSVRLRLIPVALAAWAAALVATWVPAAAPPLALALWGVAALAIAVEAMRRTRGANGRVWRVVGVLCIVAAAAAASHVALAQPARTEVQRFALEGGRAVVIDAVVVGKVERTASGQLAFDAIATRLATGPIADAVQVEISVQVHPDAIDGQGRLDVGATVEATGTAREGYPGDRAVLIVQASRGVRVVKPAGGALAVAAGLRRSLLASTSGLAMPGAGLIPGLAVGDTSAVSSELDAAMKTSSLSHLTAVSGANCALVVGLAFAAAAAAGASRRTRVACGLLALGGFVLLVTPEPSVVRAATMAAVAMLGVLLGRTGAGIAILSLAVTVLLVSDPWLAGSLGFALSTVATASLLLFARPLADGMSRWMPRPLALALSIPLAAQLACGPLLVIITPSVPLYGVVSNLLAAPAAPISTIIGLAACLAAPLPWVQAGLTAVAWLPAAWIAGTALTFSSLPAEQLPWWEGWPGVAALALVGLAIGLVITTPRASTRVRRRVRDASVLLVALVVGVQAGGAALTTVAGRWTLPEQWSVLACDIGQGDAILVRSAGAVALIDAGPEPDRLTRCLSRVGIDHIDLLVLTHYDLDHVGGVPALLGRVGTVLHGPSSEAADDELIGDLVDAGARALLARAGLQGTLGEARWSVLWPRADNRAFSAGNDSSVALDVRGGGVPSALFLGDLSASPQRSLAASGVLRPPYAIVKVAHHGSADQDAGLYRAAEPAVALFSVGADNDYGHPREETLAIMTQLGARITRTDREGVIALWHTADGVQVWRERAPPDQAQTGSVVGAR